jgi:hypothetical protein
MHVYCRIDAKNRQNVTAFKSGYEIYCFPDMFVDH